MGHGGRPVRGWPITGVAIVLSFGCEGWIAAVESRHDRVRASTGIVLRRKVRVEVVRRRRRNLRLEGLARWATRGATGRGAGMSLGRPPTWAASRSRSHLKHCRWPSRVWTRCCGHPCTPAALGSAQQRGERGAVAWAARGARATAPLDPKPPPIGKTEESKILVPSVRLESNILPCAGPLRVRQSWSEDRPIRTDGGSDFINLTDSIRIALGDAVSHGFVGRETRRRSSQRCDALVPLDDQGTTLC